MNPKNLNRIIFKVFVEKDIKYAGQAVGVVVAKTRKIAKQAANLVEITYSDYAKPVLDIITSIQEGRTGKSINPFNMSDDPVMSGDVEGKSNLLLCIYRSRLFLPDGFKKADHILEGDLHQGSQFHLTMEPIAARVIPVEDGFDVYCTTQWINEIQKVVAKVLNVPCNM